MDPNPELRNQGDKGDGAAGLGLDLNQLDDPDQVINDPCITSPELRTKSAGRLTNKTGCHIQDLKKVFTPQKNRKALEKGSNGAPITPVDLSKKPKGRTKSLH